MNTPSAKPTSGKLSLAVSQEIEHIIGHGTTKQKTSRKDFFYAMEQDDGTILLKPLNDQFVPFGDESLTVARDALLLEYDLEPDLYVKKVVPAMRKLARHINKGERHRAQQEFNSAEFEFDSALEMDEDNVRATFGLALTCLDSGNKERAAVVFEKLITLDAAFDADNKHMFNDFGISLRKNGMHEQAYDFYAKGFDLAQDDEHLLYNMARTLFEVGNVAKAREHLAEAMGINEGFRAGMELYKYLQKFPDHVDRDHPATPDELPVPKVAAPGGMDEPATPEQGSQGDGEEPGKAGEADETEEAAQPEAQDAPEQDDTGYDGPKQEMDTLAYPGKEKPDATEPASVDLDQDLAAASGKAQEDADKKD